MFGLTRKRGVARGLRALRKSSALARMGLALALTMPLATACQAQNVYDETPTDTFDSRSPAAIKRLEAEGHGVDARLYMQWSMKQSAINRGMMTDPTPDITPRTIREAIEEERERGRREDSARAIGQLRLYCRMKREGLEELPNYPREPFEFRGKSYRDPCVALSENGISPR